MTLDNSKPIKTVTHTWLLVIILLIIFWPVGVYFLVRKLSADKKASLSSGKGMIIWGWVIAGMGIVSWTTLIEDGFFSGTLGTLFFVGAGLSLVYIGKRTSLNAVKYKKYINMIINKNMKSIATIASAIPVSHDMAIKDIQEMIDKGFFDNAYINYDLDEIALSDADGFHTKVKNHNVAMVVVSCNGCGANNKVEKLEIDSCQYCGSPISG
ncbi:hypothetical protein [Sporosarcina sp. G11-34]|uniref:hypothetical protein n=1 Tax=Sporosarcina sp. G11-34 TaxID=2849605 RepID=UPI0022A92E67|nr:hypothetical protein [Sporosarcina sp. G11-34]MCZ2256941.1 hypothetical protein [Sporosarcina sp. G11-34]